MGALISAGGGVVTIGGGVPTTRNPHTIVGMGDSLTANGDYLNHLLQLIYVGSGAYWAAPNKGINGNRTDQMLPRFSVDVVALSPWYVSIWGGINDIAQGAESDTIQSNLADMYAAAHAAGIVVVALQLAPCKGYSTYTSTWQTKIDAVNAWIASKPANVDWVVPAYAALEDPENPDCLLPAYDDGFHLHLKTAGYWAVSQLVYDTVPFV